MKSPPIADRQNSKFILEELEARQLFSGGIEGIIVSETDSQVATYLNIDENIAKTSNALDDVSSTAAAESRTHEIVFVDSGIDKYELLVEDLLNNADNNRNIEVVLLDSNRNGIVQITQSLQDRDDLDAIHIISHGSDGSVNLGNTSLNSATLEQNNLQIALWANAFSETGDILIYGCNLAESEVGHSLINSLSKLTLADVAASDDLTGQASLGGDWLLEFKTGSIETSVALDAAAQADFEGILNAYLVSNTDATGAGSLHQAILDANANTGGGTDTISFNIGSGPQTIVVDAGGLPVITDSIILDATTQPGYSGTPLITLDGSATGSGINGITLRTNDSTVKGFIVINFGDEGIEMDGSTGFGDNNTIQNNWVGIDKDGNSAGNAEHGIIIAADASGNQIGGTGANEENVVGNNGFSGVFIKSNSNNNIIEGNLIGVKADGTTPAGNGGYGVLIELASDNNRIGGSTANAANVISGNTTGGIYVDGSTDATYTTAVTNTTIQGNLIGTDVTGMIAVGNSGNNVDINQGATNTIVGGALTGAGNVIAAATNDGISIWGGGTTGTFVQGNYIGTDTTGVLDLGNANTGVVVSGGSGNNQIGGTGTGEGNIIAFNNDIGVEVRGASTLNNAILGNSIYSNTLLGIDLGGDGATSNDAGDGDNGASNNLQNFPILTSADTYGSQIDISGSLNSTANSFFRIEFFASTGGPDQDYLGYANVATDGSGNATINSMLIANVADGTMITATATQSDAAYSTFTDTSEFAANMAAVAVIDDPVLNDAPYNAVPTAQVIDQDGILLFSTTTGTAISVNDLDAGSNAIQVSLSATNGSLNLSGTGGLSFSTGDGIADTTMTFTGTISDINTALEGATFIATAGYTGAANVQIITDDLGNSGTGGALSDTDNVAITVAVPDHNLWMTFEDDEAATGNAELADFTAGDIVNYGGTLTFEAGTTSGSFSKNFNLDLIAGSDGDTRVDAVHYVTRDLSVGGIDLQTGDLIMSTADIEIIGGDTYTSADVFVFRPTTEGDYNTGSFFMLIAGTNSGLFGNVTGISLVEQQTTLGDVTLNAGDFLIAHDGSLQNIERFESDELGATTSGTVSLLVKGNDIDIGQNIGALHLVQQDTAIGDTSLLAGQLMVGLVSNDNAVGDAPTINVLRQDLFLLDVTATGDGTTAATATRFFEGLDENLDSNNESIWGISAQYNVAPTAADAVFAIDENSANATMVGTVTATDPENGVLTYAITSGNTGGAFTIDAASGQITVQDGTLLDHETQKVFNLTVAAIDDKGAFDTSSVTIDVNNLDEAGINDSPENIVTADQTIDRNGMLLFSSAVGTQLAVSDFDAGANPMQVTLTATNGSINLARLQGLSFSLGDGNDDATMTFTGTLADINAALEGATFVATTNFVGDASLQILTDDQGGTGTGGPQSDTDLITIQVLPREQNLWLTFDNDFASTGNANIPSITGGDVVTYSDITQTETSDIDPMAAVTAGSFGYQFNLDLVAGTDGNTRVDAVHFVNRDLMVGGVQINSGDLLLSNDGNEVIDGVTYGKEDVFVFRPDSEGDYGAGSFFMLIDGSDIGLGKVTGMTLVAKDTQVGDVTLNQGDILLAHDGSGNNIIRFEATSLGDTTSGSTSMLIQGSDVGIDQKIAGLQLIDTNTIFGGRIVEDGQLLISLKGDDAAVGNVTPIDVKRQDIFVLHVTATGAGTSDATASRLFEGLDESLDDNRESIQGIGLQSNNAPQFAPQVLDVDENSSPGTVVGTVTASDPNGDNVHFAILSGNDGDSFQIDAITGQITVQDGTLLDHETQKVFYLSVAAIDDFGGARTATITVDINNLDEAGTNDSPENWLPADQTINQDGMLVFSSSTGTAISISDFDDGGSPVEVTLNMTNGTLNLSGTKGLSFSVGDGSADTAMTFTGTLTDINAALEGATFVATPGFAGSAGLQIVTDDQGNTGTGGTLTDTDNLAITVQSADPKLWITFQNDQGATGNGDIPSITGGDIVTFGNITQLETSDTDPLASTTSGTLAYSFNLDTVLLPDGVTPASDGNSIVDAVHYVTRDIQVGSNNIQLQTGDILLSTDANEQLDGVTYRSEDLFVFRPDTKGDYSQGSFFLLIDGSDVGLGNVTGISLVEQDTVVGGVTLNAGEFLVAHDGSGKNIDHFVAGTLGDVTTGTASVLIAGGDIDIGQDIGGLLLVQNDTEIGGVSVSSGQLLVSIKADDAIVGNAPTIDVKRHDIFVLDVTATGSGTTAATATRFFEGLDQNLDNNNESIWGIGFQGNLGPTIDADTFALDENSVNGTVVGSVTAVDPELGALQYAITEGNTNGAFAIDAATGQITVANGAALDFETNKTFSLTVAAIDPLGAYGTATVTINLNNLDEAGVNDAPENTLPADQTIGQDGMLLFSSSTGRAISISDFDDGGSPLEVTLNVTNGTLNLSGTQGLSFSVGDGSADTDMTFTGALTDINAALEGATFVATPGFTGGASLQITTDDQGNTGTGGPLTDTDILNISVLEAEKLWLTFANDEAVTGNSDIPSITGGDVVTFFDITQLETSDTDPLASTTSGSLAYSFNLDTVLLSDGSTPASDSDTKVGAVHYVTRDIQVGSNNIQLQDGDILLATDAGETIDGVIYAKEDVFVFRPDTPGDYSQGSFFLLIDGSDVGLGKVTGISLVEQETVVGGVTLNAGEFLIAHDGSTENIDRFVAGSLGDTSTGTASVLIAGADIDFDQRVSGLHLVLNDAVIGGNSVTAGQLLVSLKGEDAIVGDAPTIDVLRQDIFVLDVTATGVGTTAATASRFFEGLDLNFDSNNEDISGIGYQGNQAPTINADVFAVDENSVNGTVVGSVTAADPELSTLSYAITSGNTNGAFAIDATTGQITVANSAVLDFETTPVFNLTVAAIDPKGAYGTAAISVTLNDVNDVPVATGNTVIASEDVPLVIGPSDFNYTDAESDALASVTITGLNLNGGTLTHTGGSVPITNGMTITAAQLADLTFTSASNDSTDSSFTYTVNDADSGVTSAVMNITVNAVNDVPVATGNTVIASEDVPLVIGPSDFNFTDVESDALASVTITGLNLNGGTLTHTGGSVPVTNGMTITAAQLADLTFTSASNDSTDSSFTYTVNDADSGVTSAIMNITVNAVNDAPVATGNTVIANEDVSLVIGPTDFNFTDVESDSLVSVTITGLNLNGGTLTHSAGSVPVTNGMTITAAQLADLTFTSASNDSTDSSFTYTVNDADSGVTSAVMNITVNAVNDVPVATGNTVIASEDVPLVIGVSDFNFTDVESDALVSVTITGLNLNGGTLTHTGGSVPVTNGMTITAAQLADLTFTSASNDSTDSSFTYTVNDADSGVTSAVMNITVNAVNDAPVATGNTVIANEDVSLVIGPSDFNFTDVESDSLASVTITGLNLNGGTLTHSGGSVPVTNGMTITAAQLADLTFTSASNDSTASSFTYTVNDADSGVTSAVMNITVNAVNDVPVATGNTVIASEDVPLVINVSDFNYTDVESDSLVSVTITGLNLNGGTLTHSAGSVPVTNGMTITAAQLADLTFTSAGNDSTDSSFTYTVNDADTGVTSAVMNITVNAVNDAPVATGNTVIASEDVPLVIGPSDFNFTDVESDALASVTITGLNLNGGTLAHTGGSVLVTNGMTITAAQLADLTFTSASNDSTDSSFTYTVNDADSGVTSAIMNITVNAVNDAPVATGNTVIASEDVPLVIGVSDFNFTDVESDALASVTITGLNLNGGTLTHTGGSVPVTNGMTITAGQLADLTFTSASNDSTDSSFTYTVNDADSGVTSAVMNITVNAVNDAPVATGNTVIANEDVSLVIGPSDFNFTDVESDSLASVTITGLNLNGGTLTHTGGSVPVTNGMTITAAQLADLTFTSASNDSTDSSFTYTVNDADTGVTSAIMNITVNAVNDVPVATGNTVIASEDVPLVIGPSDFNFTDVESDSLASVTITGLNLNGGTLTHTGGSIPVTNGMTITAAQLADLTFTSASNDSTDSSFTYTVNDADTGVTSAIMNITVNAVNDAPVATGNTVIASEDVPLVIGVSDFNFTDVESDALVSVTITGLNLNGGTLTHSAGAVPVTNGMTITAAQLADLTFTSAGNDSTDSSFTYTVNDADTGVTSAVMNITVNAVNDVPVATGNTVIASEDVPLVIGPSDFNFTDVESDALASVTITGLNLNGGTLTHTGGSVPVTNGMTITAAQLADLTFTSAANDSTDSSFTYTVNDTDSGVTSAIMNVTVNAVNDAPVATGNTVIASEDVPLVIDVSDFNYTDVESDALASVTITALNLNGGTLTHSAGSVPVTNGMTITAAQLADLTFTSAANDSTDSSFTYTVNDADSGVTSAVMNITVNAVNDVPVATGNTVIANEDVPLVIGVSDFNFTDVESDSLASVTITGLNLNGGTLTHSAGSVPVTNGMTITAAQLADLTFTSASNDSTDSSFTYTVNDADSGVTSAVMNITVNAVNDAPVATGNTVIASEDVPLVIGVSDFNYTDTESDALASVTITGLNLNGGTLTHTSGSVPVTNGMTITAGQLADLTFTSASNDSTDSSFTYTVNDADSGVTSAIMNITVNAVNDVPVATGNTVLASEDVPLVIGPSDFNFTDVESDALASVTITGLNLNGGTLTHTGGSVPVTNGMTITAGQLADLTFTSASNDSTDSSFTYTVNDADSGITSAVMNITVNAVNDVPVATGNTVIASEDVPLVIGPSDFNFTDVESDALASVTITGLNLNGGTLTHTGGSVPVTNGMTITAAQLADLTFTSASNDSTDSSFTYTVNDADSGVTSAIMNITVNAVNDAPVATGNTVIASEDVPLVIGVSDFNFTDVESDALASVTITGLNLNGGTLTHTGGSVPVTNGMTITSAQLADLTFTSASNDSTDSSFTYTVNDADSGVTSAVMNITVNAVNDVPVATGNTVIASEDVPLVIGVSDFNFTDVESDALASVTITGLNLNGGTLTHSSGAVSVTNGMTVTAAELADLTFTSAANDSTDSSFTYTVNDADSGVTSAIMNITVNAVNDAPVATGNTVIASEDVPLVIGTSDFNFTDEESDSLASVTITGLNLNGGTLTHSAGAVSVTNGMTITAAQLADLTFTSASNDSTDSSFTYTVNDADSGVTSAVMNITVNSVNDVPVATGNTVIASEDVPLVIGVSDFNFSDVESDALASVTITGLNLNGGTLTHSAGSVPVINGMTITAGQLADLTFTSASNDSTDSSFTYTVNDADSGVTSAVMNITVNAVNDVPVATGNTVIASEDVPLVIGVSDFNFTDVESDALASVTITGLNLNGGTLTHTGGSVPVTNGMTITAAQLADLTFTSASNDSTDSSFTYTVNDADSGVTSAIMNITVNAVNDAPVATGNTVIASEDVPLVIDVSDFNFSDVESDALTSVTITGLNLNGGTLTHTGGSVPVTNGMTITAAQLADLTFTSASNDSTDSSFTYTVNDANTGVNSAILNITVNAVNDTTVITGNVSFNGNEGDTVVGDLNATDADGLTDGTYFSITGTLPTNGTAAINASSGAWTFIPTDPDWFGTDSFEVTVTDDVGGTTTQIINITLTNVDDPAIIGGNISGSANEGVTVAGTLTATDADGLTDGTYFTITGTLPTNGTAAINAGTGAWTFIPTDPDWFGTDSFEVTVTDDEGGTTTQIINISLTSVDDPAIISGVDTGLVTEDAAVIGSNLTTSGSLTIVDADAGESSFVAQTITGSFGDLSIDTSGDWVYSADNTQAAIQALDDGESLTDTLTVSAFDGTVHDIAITLNGTDDTAIISGVISGSVTEDTSLTSSGVLTITDADTSDNPVSFTDITSTPGDNAYGSFVLTSGTWTYTLDNANAVVQALDAGETLTDTITFTATDGSTQIASITINGSEDAPALSTNIDNQTALEGNAFALVLEPGTFTDVDSSDTLIYTASLSDDSPLPGWLSFDETTLSFSGTPSSADVGAIDVKISADDGNSTSSQAITITINKSRPAPTVDNNFIVPPVIKAIDVQNPSSNNTHSEDAGSNTSEDIVASETIVAADAESTIENEEGSVTGGLINELIGQIGTVQPIDVASTVVREIGVTSHNTASAKALEAARLQVIQDQIANQSTLNLYKASATEINELEENALWETIDKMHKQMDNEASQTEENAIEAEIVVGSTATLTAGIVSWVLRGGALMASMMSSVPLLNRFDPLPILKSQNDNEEASDEDENDDTDSTHIKQNKNVDKLFSSAKKDS